MLTIFQITEDADPSQSMRHDDDIPGLFTQCQTAA